MEFSISLFTSDRGIRPARAAQAAEECGFHAFYVPEHTHIPASRSTAHPATGDASLPDDRYLRTLDPWVALSSAASVTSRILLGTSVALPLEHDPITLAKTIASLDYLSGGRVVLGAGFGWNLEELADHGIPPTRRRQALREYLEAMRELWTAQEASYEGEFVRFGPSWAWPKPVQQQRVPTLIGAFGSEKLFSWITRSADGWITTPIEEELDTSVTLLRRMWHEAGRNGEPRIVVLDAKADESKVRHWEDLGISEVLYGFPDATEDESLAFLSRLSPLVSKFA